MTEQDQSKTHPDWNREPVIREGGFKPMFWKNGSIVYIIGDGRDGKRYCRTIEVSVVDDAANQRLQDTFELVRKIGPRVCKEFVPEGNLPSEADMPPLPET